MTHARQMLRRAALLHAGQQRREQCSEDRPPKRKAAFCGHDPIHQTSRTLDRLVKKATSGKMAAIEAVRTAADVQVDYGATNDGLEVLASLAGKDEAPQNAHRDFHRWCKTFSVALEPAAVQVTYKDPKDHGTIPKTHYVLYPHEVFGAVWDAGADVFKHVFLGDHGDEGLVQY